MSNVVDTRAVELQFNNREFEKNAEQSIETLGRLDRAIDNTASGRGMEYLGEATESVSVKFDLLEVAAVRALSGILESVINLGASMLKGLTIDNITLGWSKYNKKVESTQTIMNAIKGEFTDAQEKMDYVNGQLQRLVWFTDETSYRFSDMVGGIGKFSTAGVELQESVTAMEGISNWAAMCGINAKNATPAFEAMSKAMGQGYMSTKFWLSLERMNMNSREFQRVAIETAEEMGYLKKVSEDVWKTTSKAAKSSSKVDVTVEAFRNSLSTQWFSKDVMNAVLNKYGGFADKLQELCADYADLGMYATEALQIVNNYDGIDSLRQVAEEMGVPVEELDEKIKVLASDEYDLGRRAFKAAQEAKTFEEAIDATKEAVASRFANMFEMVFGDYLSAKSTWTNLSNELYEYFVEPLNTVQHILGNYSTNTQWVDELGNEVNGQHYIIKTFSIFLDSLKAVGNIFKDTWSETFPLPDVNDIADFVNKINSMATSIRDFIELVGPDLGSAMKIILAPIKIIIDIIKQMGGVFNQQESTVQGFLADVIHVLGKIGEVIDTIEQFIARSGIVKDVIEGIGGVFDKIFGAISQKLSPVTNKLSEMFGMMDEYTEPESLSDMLETSLQLYQTFKDNLIPTLELFRQKIDPVIQTIRNIVTPVLRVMKKVLLEIWDAFKKTLGVVTTDDMDPIDQGLAVLDGIVQKVSDLWEKLEPLRTAIATMWNLFVETLDSTDWESMFESIGTVTDTIIGFVNDLATNIGGAVTGDSNDGIGKIAAVIIAIIGLLKLFQGATMLSWDADALWTGIGLIKRTFRSLKYMAQEVQFAARVTIFKNIALILLAIAASLVLIATIDPDKLTMAATTLILILAAVMAAITTLGGFSAGTKKNKFNYSGIKGARNMFYTMLPIILLIATIVAAMLLLKDVPADQMNDITMVIAGVLTAVVGAIVIISKQSNAGMLNASTTFASIGVMIALIGAGILLISKAFEVFDGLDQDKIVTSTLAIVAILGAMMGIMKIQNESKNSGVKTVLQATSFAIMAASLLVIVGAVALLAKIPTQQMWAATIALGLIAIVLGLIMAIFAKCGGLGADYILKATAFAVMCGSLLLISASIRILGGMDQRELRNAAIALGILSLVMGLIILSFNKTKTSGTKYLKIAGSFLIMTAGLMLIAASLKSLSGMSTSELTAAGVAVGAIAALLAIIIGALGAANASGSKYIKIAAAFVIVAASLVIVAYSIKQLTNIDFDHLTASCVALAAMMVVIAACLSVLSEQNGIVGKAAAFLIMAAAMLVIADALGALAEISADDMWRGVAALLAISLALTVILGILAVLGANAGYAATAFLAMAVSVALIGAGLLAAVTAMEEAANVSGEGITNCLESIIQALNTTAPMFLEFLGEFLAGVLQMLTDLLPEIGTFLVELVNTIVGTINEAFPTILSLISAFFLSILDQLPGTISKIAEVLDESKEDIASVIVTLITVACEALSATAPTIIATIGGILDALLTWLVDWTPTLVQYVADIIIALLDGLEVELPKILDKIDEFTATLLEALSTFLAGLLGDVIQFVIDMATGFADELDEHEEEMKTAIRRVFESILHVAEGLLLAAPTAFLNAGKRLLNDSVGLLAGFNELKDDFWDAVKSLVVDSIESALKNISDWFDAGTKLVDELNNGVLAKAETFHESVMGLVKRAAYDIGYYSVTDGPSIGIAFITGIIDGITGNDSKEKVTGSSKTVVQWLKDGFKEAIGLKTDTGEEGGSEFKPIGEQIVQGIINGVESYIKMRAAWPLVIFNWIYEKITGKEAFDINSPSKKMEEVGGYILDGLMNGLKNELKKTSLGNAALAVYNLITGKFSTADADGQSSAASFLDGLKKPFDSQGNRAGAKSAFLAKVDALVSDWNGKFTGITDDGDGIGKNFLDGLKNGILNSDKIKAFKDAVKGLANNLPQWVKDVLGIKSPSRVMMKIGAFAVEGLTQGIDNNSEDVKNSSTRLANNCVQSVKKVIEDISSAIDSDIQDPVIKPVLDTSGIVKGMGDIDDLMSGTRSIAASAGMTGSYMMGGSNITYGGATYTFNQNNYSPKALSRIDIYRQTRSQFAMLKGVAK